VKSSAEICQADYGLPEEENPGEAFPEQQRE
jgi:hypothetical protein